MKPSLLIRFSILLCAAAFVGSTGAQTLVPAGDKASAQLEALTKKIDEQNLKIDALSQQLLKMEKQIASIRPGVMIGETTPSAPRSPASAPAPAPASGENAHVVTKGETLTSIAKNYKVGVGELQRFNHIENDRALQIGQTIMIPTPAGSSPTPPAVP